MRRSRRLLLSAVVSFAAAVSAQSCPPVPMIVDVLDAHGLPIQNLTSANFAASYKGQPLSVSSASFRTDPSVRTVLLLSHKAPAPIGKAAALEFISTAPPQEPISMFTFFTTIDRRFNSSDGRKAMEDWLNDNARTPETPRKPGGSDLTQTLLTIVKAMKPAHVGDTIYLITDNLDPLFFPKDSKQVPAAAADLANELQSSGIRLFVLVLEIVPRTAWNVVQPDYNMITTPHTPTGTPELAELVRQSGGLALDWYPASKSRSFAASFDYDSPTQAAVRESSRGFQAAISNFYVLTVAQPGNSTASEDWKLEVVDSLGKKMKGVTMGYPSKIRGCAVTAH